MAGHPEVVTSAYLKKNFGSHAANVLSDYLQYVPQERKRGVKKKWKVIKPLPTEEEFAQMRAKKFTDTVENLVSDAFNDFESLRDELQDWYDNLPENFQQGDKGDTLQSSIDTLERIEQPDCPEFIRNFTLVFFPVEDCTSRSDRRDDAVGRLAAIVEALGEEIEEQDAEGKAKYTEEQRDEIQQLIDDLENCQSEAEEVEFPQMFG